MNTETIVFVAAALVTLAGCGFLLWQQRAHYEALLRDVRADNRDLRDRVFASKNLPPSGVDMRKEHEERREERRRRQADPTTRSEADPTQRMRQQLAENEKARLGKPK